MNPIPLILSFGSFCFCLTGPVSPWVEAFSGVVLGWNAALYYAAKKVGDAKL